MSNEPGTEDPESRDNLFVYLEKLKHNMQTYRNHRIRSIHDVNLMNETISNLKDWQVLIISDWKMKMLYLEYRESMHAFFSKRGIPWCGTLFIRNKRPDEYKINGVIISKISNFESDKVLTFVDTIVGNVQKIAMRWEVF